MHRHGNIVGLLVVGLLVVAPLVAACTTQPSGFDSETTEGSSTETSHVPEPVAAIVDTHGPAESDSSPHLPRMLPEPLIRVDADRKHLVHWFMPRPE